MNDIYYIVRLKNNFKMPDTTIKHTFCGKILLTKSDGTTIFELNGSTAIVIIQLEHIEWMAPSRVLWNKRKRNGCNNSINDT